MKQKVEVSLILPYDLVISPGFSGATFITEMDLVKLRREKEIKLRREKIEKINARIISK